MFFTIDLGRELTSIKGYKSRITLIVTGAAGFIATNLINQLLLRGYRVLAFDNLSRGTLKNLLQFSEHPNFVFRQVSVDSYENFNQALKELGVKDVSAIWHLAANSDIPAGIADSAIDLRDTFLTTYCALRIAKEFKIPEFYFASSSAVYGDHGDVQVSESTGPLLPISNYGAMKLASEAQISAAVESFLKRAIIFRFPNIVGVPATHGVILDFLERLHAHPSELQVLGNGGQKKIYLHVSDLIDAMLFLFKYSKNRLGVFNIGPNDDGITVSEIAKIVVNSASPNANILYGNSDRGWVGDVPRFQYSTKLINGLGWKSMMNSKSAVIHATKEIMNQKGYLS